VKVGEAGGDTVARVGRGDGTLESIIDEVADSRSAAGVVSSPEDPVEGGLQRGEVCVLVEGGVHAGLLHLESEVD
ncbi:hypothetical protein KBZ21_48065, partial [Streptomyces sp. A73]|nr:hypothetical protein [Streptomyces sp. A73]